MDSGEKQSLLVWDTASSSLPDHYINIVLWQSFGSELYPNAVSMPKLVEQNADNLKNKYLKLVYDLGQIKLNGQILLKHFQLYPDFNYWWMTLIVEKCNFTKSDWINDAIRLLAFEYWIDHQKINNLKLVSANVQLASCLGLLCQKRKIIFEWQHLNDLKTSRSISNRIYGLFSKKIQALVWFVRYLASHVSLKGQGLKEWRSTEGSITFVSYSDNLDTESIMKGEFNSNYWAHLPEVLLKNDTNTNWLHLYIKDAILPSAKKAASTIRSFNQTGQGKQIHSTLDTFLGWRVVWNSLYNWLCLFKVGRKLKKLCISDLGEEFYLWPLIQIDFKESLFGPTALKNLLYYNLFYKGLQLLPKQKRGVYLQENQGWEFGLIQAWKEAGHSFLIGVPHSTVRFWDLRYFFDSRSYNGNLSNQLPRPNMVAVNGRASRKSYLQGGYPQNELVDIEALRYLHLKTLPKNKHTKYNKIRPIRILVLLDYLVENSHYQMRILEEAYSSFSNDVTLTVKPHPNNPIDPKDFPKLKMDITTSPLPNLLDKCDVAFTGTVTSAAIDAYYSNTHVISVIEPKRLNMSPLRGMPGVTYISTVKQLTTALNIVLTKQNNKFAKQDYFIVDSTLNKWRKLLLENSM
ncbi:TIGR04326 family surface carbohydrate biosynthesis protein [Bacteroidota bacterium]